MICIDLFQNIFNMSKNTNPKKKVVVPVAPAKPSSTATTSIPRMRLTSTDELLFTKTNFMWMGIGVALIVLGLALMSGGKMPNPETWDPNLIYSFRRTVLAPIVILAGLGVEVYAIFKRG